MIGTALLLLLVPANPSAVMRTQANDALILRWRLDSKTDSGFADESGHGHNAKSSARVSEVGGVAGAFLDGTPQTAIQASVPQVQGIGKGSWTISAWVQPTQFNIDAPQRQRRLFMLGSYPEACVVVDLLQTGSLSLYSCFKEGDKIQDEQAMSSRSVPLNRWCHVVIEADRAARSYRMYLNGSLRSRQTWKPGFDNLLAASPSFTVGSEWQNYIGYVAEVQLHAKALSSQEVRSLFDRSRARFKRLDEEIDLAANAAEEVTDLIQASDQAHDRGDIPSFRKTLRQIVGDPRFPAEIRALQHLRLARSLDQTSEGVKEWRAIGANREYPAHLRAEAQDLSRNVTPRIDPVPVRYPAPKAQVFISPTGQDASRGTRAKPWATLQRALTAVPKLIANGRPGSVEIVCLPGRYGASSRALIEKAHSGTASSPLIIRADTPGTVSFYGGKTLTGFRPVTDPAVLSRLPEESGGKVLEYDLKANGVSQLGELKVRGFGQQGSPPPTLEVFADGKVQTLARWPNETFVEPTKLVDPGSASSGRPAVLEYANPRHERWVGVKDAWLFGYFEFLWADGTVKLGSISPSKKTLTTAAPYRYLSDGMSNAQGIKYYVFNLLEELDSPGEWFLDRETSKLYLFPPSNPAKLKVEVSVEELPFLTIRDAKRVVVRGIDFDLARGKGLEILHSDSITLTECSVKRVGGDAITVWEGTGNVIDRCNLQTIGRTAIELSGGVRETLTPGGHAIQNCRIRDFGRIDRTYTPGVRIHGVGQRVIHNEIAYCPSSALRVEGNDHLVAMNEVHHVLQESDDQGAVDMWGNPTYRGVKYLYNYFHDIGSGNSQKLAHGQAGIRLDDVISGMLVYGNVFVRSGNGSFGAVQINSGRDNIIDNNVIVGSERGISGGYYPQNPVWAQLAGPNKPQEFYTNELYLSRYPEMKQMLVQPANNRYWRNLFVRVGRDVTGDQTTSQTLSNKLWLAKMSPFEKVGVENWAPQISLRELRGIAMRAIPFGQIGPVPQAKPRNKR